MPKVSIHLEISGNDEKLPFGPITDPNPGPTFEIEVAAPDIEVIKSRPVNDNKAVIIKKITMYKYIKEITEDMNFSSILLLSYLIINIPRG